MPSSRINREKIRTRSQIADYIICKAIPDPLQIDPNSLPTLLWPKDDVSFTFPYLTTSKWLEKRASMFEKWSELASQNIPPKKLRIERLARVSLVLYVKHRTGKPHFTHVIKLLDFAGAPRYSATSTVVIKFTRSSKWIMQRFYYKFFPE